MKKKYYLALGSCIVASILGMSLVLPIFDDKTGWQYLQSLLESDTNINPVADEPGENSTGIGWELLDNNTVFHMWNQYNDYYFNATNGVQFSNHYEEYWTTNVLMLGYYTGDEWNLLYRTDELSNFNRQFDNQSEYINITLWKDLSYSSYDFRLALRYHLGANDSDLTIIPYIKNLGIAIPFQIGFGWEMKDINIANVTNDNYLRIFNGTDFEDILLNQSLDRSFTDMDLNTSINLICKNPPSPFLSRNLYLKWNHTLNYKVTVKSRANQYNAPTTLFIKVGTLAVGQEKFTKMNWLDADDWLGISGTELDTWCGDNGIDTPANILNGNGRWWHNDNEDHWFVVDLGETYTIKKVRGRGSSSKDPIDINIYIDDSNPPTTLCEEGITTWQDTTSWSEITLTTEGTGQYLKVEIEDTEYANRQLDWYTYSGGWLTCFDAYGDVAGPANAAPTMSGQYPGNGTTNVPLNPTVAGIVNDTDVDTITVTWQSNYTGSYVTYQNNLSVASDTNVTWDTTGKFNTASTTYWWKVYLNDGTVNDSSYYSFTTVANVSRSWNKIHGMTCNFSLGNTTIPRTWQTLSGMLCNFSLGNTSIPKTWNILSGLLCNFSLGNTSIARTWNPMNGMLANFSLGNTSIPRTWQELSGLLCNFSLGNTTIPHSWNKIHSMTANFSLGNTSIPRTWNAISSMVCNFSLGNTSIPRTWQPLNRMLANFSIGNTSIARTWNKLHTVTANFSLGNTSISPIWNALPSMFCNFSLGNTSISRTWQTLPSMTCNFSLGNTSIARVWNTLPSMFCNFSLGNTSISRTWNSIPGMFCNFSLGNTSITHSWNSINNMLCNFSLGNTSVPTRGWNVVPSMLCNFSLGNTSVAVIIINEYYPVNESTNIPVNVTLWVNISNKEGNQMNISWYYGNSSENATTFLGSQNDSISNGTYYIANPYANDTTTIYWWKVNVSDGNGNYLEEIYYYNSSSISSWSEVITTDRVNVFVMISVMIGLIVIYLLFDNQNQKKKRR